MSCENSATEPYRRSGSLRSAFITIVSRSPRSRRCSSAGCKPRWVLTDSGVIAVRASPSRDTFSSLLLITTLGFSGSVSQTSRSISKRDLPPRVFRSHGTPVRSSDQCSLEALGIQQFGDAKVQESGHTAFCDQDIARLEIAMNHQLFMRVLHRGTDLAKEPQTVVDGELVQIAILVNGQAFHILHHQIRGTIFAAAAVEELHNVGMVQRRKCLSLIAETVKDLLGVDSGLDHFYRNLLPIVLVVALAQIHHRHAALPNLADDAVRPNPSSRHRTRLRGQQISGGTILKKGGGAIEARQQRFYFGAQGVVASAGLTQKTTSLLGVSLQGQREQLLHLVPLFRHLSGRLCVAHAQATPLPGCSYPW